MSMQRPKTGKLSSPCATFPAAINGVSKLTRWDEAFLKGELNQLGTAIEISLS
jgi:hypothetical protein